MGDFVNAARRGDLSAVKRIVKKSRDSSSEVDSALRHATMMGHVNVVEFLIKHGGINIRSRGHLGRTALMTAMQCTDSQKTIAILPMLLAAGATVNDQVNFQTIHN